MLTLTRKKSETIHIGDNITITIQRVKGNAVRIGVDAPRDIEVLRGELLQERLRKSEELSRNSPPG